MSGKTVTPGAESLYADAASSDSYEEAGRKLKNLAGVDVPASTLQRHVAGIGEEMQAFEREDAEAEAPASKRVLAGSTAPEFRWPRVRSKGVAGKQADGTAKTSEGDSSVPLILQFRSGMSRFGFGLGASQFLWLCGCGATGPSFEEVGRADVFETASYGEQGVGARFRPAASRRFESVAEDVLAGAFRDAGSDRQSMLPIEVALHSGRVGLTGANAGRDSFGPVAVRLRNGDHFSGLPAGRESSETAPGPNHAEPPQSRLQPSNTEPGRNAKTQNQFKPKKLGCTQLEHWL